MKKDYKCREDEFLSEESFDILCEPAIARPRKESIGKYVNLLNDTGFKHVFGREANKDIIIAFLNEIIPDRHILDIEHLRNEQIPLRINSKKSVYDLYCKTDDGSKIIVELQNDPQKHFVDRAIYYSTFPVQAQVERGDKEYTLCPIYVVSILNFTLPELEEEKRVLSTFRLKEINTGKVLSNKYTFVFIELGKFNKQLHQLDQNNILECFYYCLKHIGKLQERPLELQQEIMARLFEAAQVAAMQPEELEKYISTMVTERDIRNYISYAQEKGWAEGRAEGRAEGLAEGEVIGKTKGIHKTARNMKAKGISVKTIMECTGLSVEEIERL